MSVEVGTEQPTKSQSPRPSLVAPWNPPSYIRPLATNPGAATGGHWRSMGDDYTEMTFNLSRDRTSPTTMLQHLCVMEGHYTTPSRPPSSSISPTLAPPSPSRAQPQIIEPKVVRADPQGRRRHSSETFSSTSSSNSTPSGGVSTTHPTPANPSASNGSYLTEGQSSRWTSSASFDSVWMSVEGLGDSNPAQTPGFESGTGASSSSSSASLGGRMCRNMSGGYQNGLNYIALELREDGSSATTVTSGSDTGSSSTPTGTVPLPENGAYASIDFSRSDRVSSSTND